MQTIQLEIQDDIYESLLDKGINFNTKIKEFLHNLVDDGYPSITSDEAKSRVNNAVNRYQDGTGTYVNQDKYSIHIK